MKIRRATLEDAEEITQLRADSFERINGEEYPKELILSLKQKNTSEILKEKLKDREMFCLVNGKEILGTVALKGKEITSLFVKYTKVRQGIGTKLIQFIEGYARKKGIKKVFLTAAQRSKGFYLKNHYTLVKEIIKPGLVLNKNYLM